MTQTPEEIPMGSGANQPLKKEPPNFEDMLQLEAAFARRLASRNNDNNVAVDNEANRNDDQAGSLETSIKFSTGIIEKVNSFCDQLHENLEEMVNWQSRESVFKFFDDLRRLFKMLFKTMALTSGEEEIDQQAERFQVVFEKFFVAYLAVLEEAKKHTNEDDIKLGIPVIAENELAEQRLVLEDDMMQEILSTNHLVLESLKKSTKNSALVEILENY